MNDGATAWPQGTKLIFIRGDRELVLDEEFPVELAQPGQEINVNVMLNIPNKQGKFSAIFRLADLDRTPFGPRLWVDLQTNNATSSSSSSSSSSSTPAPTTPAPTPSAPLVVPVVEVKPKGEESVSSSVSSTSVQQGEVAAPSPSPAPVATPTALPVRHEYEDSLKALESMGFVNRELNIYLLQKSNGDLQHVVNKMLEKLVL